MRHERALVRSEDCRRSWVFGGRTVGGDGDGDARRNQPTVPHQIRLELPRNVGDESTKTVDGHGVARRPATCN